MVSLIGFSTGGAVTIYHLPHLEMETDLICPANGFDCSRAIFCLL